MKLNAFEMDKMVLDSYNKDRYCVVSSFSEDKAECELVERPVFVNKNMVFNFGKLTIYIDVFRTVKDAMAAVNEFNEDYMAQ